MKIKDQNFLAYCDMPPMYSYEEALNWIGNSRVMMYIFGKVRRVLFFDENSNCWQGMNYGEKNRILLSKSPNIRETTRLMLRRCEMDKLDLISPIKSFHRIGDYQNFQHEQIIKTIFSKKNIMRYFWISAIKNGVIIKETQNNTTYWKGCNYTANKE